ncbi:MAG TPA: peptidoglycan-associated lipoprotein Pal [Macromonas sp.]|nr:peptidoglycan-associated lipoprotein Pal [Macromonas sp.]
MQTLTTTPSTLSKRRFAGWQAAAAVALTSLVLAGCGSSVKLDDVPVSDRSGVPLSGGADGAAGNGSGVGMNGAAGNQIDGALAGQPPKNLGRVVYFDFDDFTVRSEYTPLVEGHARYLTADRKRHVVLEGSTDERGGREYNLALGQKRAEAVRRSLSLLGVTETQMETVSFGEEKPAKQGADEEAYRLNRRVEISYR